MAFLVGILVVMAIAWSLRRKIRAAWRRGLVGRSSTDARIARIIPIARIARIARIAPIVMIGQGGLAPVLAGPTRGASVREEEAKRDREIDEASAQSFPASDPPSSTAVHAGPPRREASGRRPSQ
jgi:hypothetical protein